MSTATPEAPTQAPVATIPKATTWKQPLPPVGLRVVWYEHCNLQKPVAATVCMIGQGGLVDLLTERIDGHHRTKRGVWHKDDPSLKTKDHLVRSERGCWDFIPGTLIADMHEPGGLIQKLIDALEQVNNDLQATKAEVSGLKDKVMFARAEVATIKSDDPLDREILKLVGDGMDFQKIADRLRVTGAKVAAVVRAAKAPKAPKNNQG